MAYIKVAVITGAKKESIIAKSPDHFLISVKEKAKNNMANKEAVELVANYFKVPREKVRIVNGHHRPHKLLAVDIKP